MTENHHEADGRYRAGSLRSRWERREFLAIGGGVGATLFAGCTSDSVPGDEPDDGTADGTDGASNFRLLISDRPADIDDFDSLEVTFDGARIFTGGAGDGDDGDDGDAQEDDGATDTPETEEDADGTPGSEDDGEGTEAEGDEQETEAEDEEAPQAEDEEATEAEDEQETEAEDEQETEAEDEEATEAEDDEGDGNRGFYEIELDDVTVDLTEVVGEKAMEAGSGELSPGTYQKIELHVSDVEGIVDGQEAEVKVPSEKLQLTKPFEITEGETVDFVFDINVVKRGNEQRYNLKPVISKSGLVGEDVGDHEVVGESQEAEDDDDPEDDDDDSEVTDDPEETEEPEETDEPEETEEPTETAEPTETVEPTEAADD